MLPHASLGSFSGIWAVALLCIMSRRVNRTQECVVSTGIICHIQVLYTKMPLYTFYVSLNLSYWLKTMYSNCISWVAPQCYRPRVRCLGVRKRLAFDTPSPQGEVKLPLWRQSSIFTCDEVRGRPGWALLASPPSPQTSGLVARLVMCSERSKIKPSIILIQISIPNNTVVPANLPKTKILITATYR